MAEILTPMAFALCASLHIQCTTAADIFIDNALKDSFPYDRAIECNFDECDLDEDRMVCVQMSTRPVRGAPDFKVYFCRPRDNEGEGADS